MPKRESHSHSESERHKKTKAESAPTLKENFRQGDLLFGIDGKLKNKNLGSLKDYSQFEATDLNNPSIYMVMGSGKNNWKFDELTEVEQKHYEMLEKNKEYLEKPGGKNISDDMPHRDGVAIRRACKLLVRKANKTQRIHFEIGDVDLERVCKNEKDDLGITNSEIRAAYRQAVRVEKNPYHFFYKKGVQTVPPWEDPINEKHFDDYKARIKKI